MAKSKRTGLAADVEATLQSLGLDAKSRKKAAKAAKTVKAAEAADGRADQGSGPSAEKATPRRVAFASKKSDNLAGRDWSVDAAFLPPKLLKLPGLAAGTPWYDELETELAKAKNKPETDEPAVWTRARALNFLAQQSSLAADARASTKSQSGVWISRALSGGTLSDKVAAAVMQVAESPVYSADTIRQLVGYCKKKGHRESALGIDALVELFVAKKLVPANRPLRSLTARASNGSLHNETPPRAVLLMAFEDVLASLVTEWISVLEIGTFDTLQFFKKKCITALYSMLAAVPTGERSILNVLVNKLGDPERRIASHILYLLNDLLHKNPGMVPEVLNRVEASLLNRRNVSFKSLYFAIIFLNSLKFRTTDPPGLPGHLLSVYLSLFTSVLGSTHYQHSVSDKKGFQKARKRRASAARKAGKTPTAPSDDDPLKSFDADKKSKLISVLLQGIARILTHTNVLSVGAREDSAEADAAAAQLNEQIDSLFKISHSDNFVHRLNSLSVLFRLVAPERGAAQFSETPETGGPGKSSGGSLTDRYYRSLYAALSNIQAFAFSSTEFTATRSLSSFLNLVYWSVKADWSPVRVKAFVRRILMLATVCPPALAVSLLFLVYNLQSDHRALKAWMSWRRRSAGATLDPEGAEEPTGPAAWASSWKAYTSRNPEFNQTLAGMWPYELVVLAASPHPTISKFALALIDGHRISYSSDPLVDFGLAAWLGRFVAKNPKKTSKSGADGMTPDELAVEEQDGGGSDLLSMQEAEMLMKMYRDEATPSVDDEEKEGDDFIQALMEAEMAADAGADGGGSDDLGDDGPGDEFDPEGFGSDSEAPSSGSGQDAEGDPDQHLAAEFEDLNKPSGEDDKAFGRVFADADKFFADFSGDSDDGDEDGEAAEPTVRSRPKAKKRRASESDGPSSKQEAWEASRLVEGEGHGGSRGRGRGRGRDRRRGRGQSSRGRSSKRARAH